MSSPASIVLIAACLMVISYLASCSWTPKIEATVSPEPLVGFQQTTLRYIPEDRPKHNDCCVNLKSQKLRQSPSQCGLNFEPHTHQPLQLNPSRHKLLIFLGRTVVIWQLFVLLAKVRDVTLQQASTAAIHFKCQVTQTACSLLLRLLSYLCIRARLTTCQCIYLWFILLSCHCLFGIHIGLKSQRESNH